MVVPAPGAGPGPAALPEQSAPALPQLVLGGLAWLVHPDPVALRLEMLLFAALAAGLVVTISRHLGASTAWSLVAGAALLVFPVFASVSTS